MKHIILFLIITNLFSYNIKDYLFKEYKKEHISQKFDKNVELIINKTKKEDSTLEKIKVNYFINAKKKSLNIIKQIFILHRKNMHHFLKIILKKDNLYNLILNNYNQKLIYESKIIDKKLNKQFGNKFIQLNQLSKQKVFDELNNKKKIIFKENINNIYKKIDKYLNTEMQKSLGVAAIENISLHTLDVVPVVGWIIGVAHTIYSLATLNDFYDNLGKKIKKAFHHNEYKILFKIAHKLHSIDLISQKYNNSLILKRKQFVKYSLPLYNTKDKKLITYILAQKDYPQFITTFYHLKNYKYLAYKFINYPNKAEFLVKIEDINYKDLKILEKIENKFKIRIEGESFFNTLEMIDKIRNWEIIKTPQSLFQSHLFQLLLFELLVL